jgi:hypothetical protein
VGAPVFQSAAPTGIPIGLAAGQLPLPVEAAVVQLPQPVPQQQQPQPVPLELQQQPVPLEPQRHQLLVAEIATAAPVTGMAQIIPCVVILRAAGAGMTVDATVLVYHRVPVIPNPAAVVVQQPPRAPRPQQPPRALALQQQPQAPAAVVEVHAARLMLPFHQVSLKMDQVHSAGQQPHVVT